MRVEVGKILGRVAAGWWVQVHDYEATGEQGQKRGHLVAAASLCQPQLEAAAAMSMGREVLSRLHELYYGDLAGDPLAALRRAAADLQAEFAGVELVGVAVVETAVYVVGVGGGGVWTKIGDREGWLVNPNRVAADLSALSGWGQPGQVLIVGNSRFWQALTLGAVRAAVVNTTRAAEIAEGLGPVVHGSDRGIGGVGVVVQVLNPKFEAPNKLRTPSSKPVGPIYISSGDKTRSQRRGMWLGVGFLSLLLLLVGGWQWRRAYLENQQSEQNQRLEELVYKFNQARVLVELNPVRSRQLLTEVGTELQRFKETKKKDDRVAQVEADFGAVLGVATGVKQVTAAEVLDLGWLRQGMTGARLALVSDRLVVLDAAAGRLVVVDPAKKNGEVIAGQADLGQAKLMAGYPGKVVVWSDKGVIEFSIFNFQFSKPEIKIPFDGSWGEIVDMGMFAGNIYLLTKSAIWRYQATDSGYGSAAGWLAQSEDSSELNLSSNMAIDGFIWVMLSDGQILKYARGARENFGVSDLDQPLAPGAIIYTDSEAEKLYVLDRSRGRIVVLDKTGAYRLQYRLDQAQEATDLVVDEKEGKFYLLAGPKIWAGEL